MLPYYFQFTFKKYFDVRLPTAQVNPTFISKINTVIFYIFKPNQTIIWRPFVGYAIFDNYGSFVFSYLWLSQSYQFLHPLVSNSYFLNFALKIDVCNDKMIDQFQWVNCYNHFCLSFELRLPTGHIHLCTSGIWSSNIQKIDRTGHFHSFQSEFHLLF